MNRDQSKQWYANSAAIRTSAIRLARYAARQQVRAAGLKLSHQTSAEMGRRTQEIIDRNPSKLIRLAKQLESSIGSLI